MRSELVEVEVEVLRETAKAVLVTDGNVEAWVPRSQCELHKVEGKRSLWVITLPENVALDKGLT